MTLSTRHWSFNVFSIDDMHFIGFSVVFSLMGLHSFVLLFWVTSLVYQLVAS